MGITGLTMFRARDGLHDLDELLPDRASPDKFDFADFRLSDGSIAMVYYRRTVDRPPRWASFFDGIVPDGDLRSRSSSAVVVFEREGRWYLVTFGYGRHFIDLDRIEPTFGLRVALNALDPTLIRSVDRKRVDTVSRLTREQLSRDSRIGSFGLDVHQDLLSAVTGVPDDDSLGSRIYGRDAVGLRLDIQPADLGLLADRLEELFQDDGYKEQFRWVDNIAEVRGAQEARRLTEALVIALREGPDYGGFDLAPPEIVDWSRAYGFLYPGEAEPEPELTLAAYFNLVRDRSAVSEDLLRNDRVRLLDIDGQRMGGWSILRCLAGELTINGQVFVINDGKWYRVDSDFASEIDQVLDGLTEVVVDLPAYGPDDPDEGGYNERVARESNGLLALMDERFIWPRQWQDRIEFCDLYRADGTMIHVKRYAGGSASLSHLFSQGSVSVRCLLSDRAFVADLERLLPETHSLGGASPSPDDCRVVFAVVAGRGDNLRLPFFSRVSLRNASEVIQNLGASVSFQVIRNTA